MQKRSSLKEQGTSAGLAAIEFGETYIHESGIVVYELGQIIEPAAEQCQYSRRAVPGLATGFAKHVDAGAEPFQGTSVSRNEVVESRARIWMTAELVAMIAAVRICAVVEKPFESGRVH